MAVVIGLYAIWAFIISPGRCFMVDGVFVVHEQSVTNTHCTKELGYLPTQTLSSGNTMEVRGAYPLIAQAIAIKTDSCSNADVIRRSNFTVQYKDATDKIGHILMYSDEMGAQLAADERSVDLRFDTPLYTESLYVTSTTADISCISMYIKGCEVSSMCPNNPSVCNGGTCIGDGRCACPVGKFGETCDSNFTAMTVDDFDPIVMVDTSLYTQSGTFAVVGDVSLQPGDTTNNKRRNIRSPKSDQFWHGRRNPGLDNSNIEQRELYSKRTSLNHFLKILFSGGSLINVGQSHHSSHHHGSSGTLHSVFQHLAHGFTHVVNAVFGQHHNHHNQHYFFTTHGWQHHNHGCSLSYALGRLHLHVHFDHHHYHVHTSFHPHPGVSYHIGSAFSPSCGASIFINGHLVQSLVRAVNAAVGATSQQSLCMGSCGHPGSSGHHHVATSHPLITGAGPWTLMANSALGLLGLPFLNFLTPKSSNTSFPWQQSTLAATQPITTSLPATLMSTTGTSQMTSSTGAHSSTSAAKTSSLTTRTTTFTTTLPVTATTVGYTRQSSNGNSTASGPVCFECTTHQMADGMCNRMQQCKLGEVCAAFQDTSGYIQRCMEEKPCLISQYYSSNNCWYCCNAHLCNHKCLSAPTGPITGSHHSSTTPAPSTAAPCFDMRQCSTLKIAGYDVCRDQIVATSLCRKTCHIC